MRDEDNAMIAAAWGGFVLITRDERGDGFGELFAERGAIHWGTKANHGVDRQCGQALVQLFRFAQQAADFANDARGERDQVACGKAIRVAVGIDTDRSHRGGRHHIRGCGGDEQALGESAPLALFGDSDQAMSFERAEVIVDSLAGNSELRSKHGSRSGLGETRKDAGADRVQRDGRGGGIVDDFDGKHEEIRPLTKLFVNRNLCLSRQRGVS
jgi:hypothetical protein